MRFATLFESRGLAAVVNDALIARGIETSTFTDAECLSCEAQAQSFEAFLVEDVGDLIGGWLERLQSGPGAPMVVVAVGAGGTVEMSRAFSHGVDDYHFTANPVEQLLQRALARVSAKMRQMSVPVLRIGPYVLDRSRSVLASSGGEIHLSPREFSFVHSLIEAQGGTVQMERLCERICGQMNGAARRAVRQHAHVVRRKLSLVAASIGRAEALRVESVYGQGYRLAFEWREAAPL